MTWAAISRFGRLALVFVDGKMNSEYYQQMLTDNLLPFLQHFHRLPWIFQQDNAAIHVSASSREWFARNNVAIMKSPAKSPDLNIIENVWAILARDVYENCRQFDTVQQLREAIEAAWSRLSVDYLKNLYESLPKRMMSVLKKNGNAIKY